jgi:hypothetical protein
MLDLLNKNMCLFILFICVSILIIYNIYLICKIDEHIERFATVSKIENDILLKIAGQTRQLYNEIQNDLTLTEEQRKIKLNSSITNIKRNVINEVLTNLTGDIPPIDNLMLSISRTLNIDITEIDNLDIPIIKTIKKQQEIISTANSVNETLKPSSLSVNETLKPSTINNIITTRPIDYNTTIKPITQTTTLKPTSTQNINSSLDTSNIKEVTDQTIEMKSGSSELNVKCIQDNSQWIPVGANNVNLDLSDYICKPILQNWEYIMTPVLKSSMTTTSIPTTTLITSRSL